MSKVFRRGFWTFFAFTLVALVGRVFFSFALSAAAVTQALGITHHDPAAMQHFVMDTVRGFGDLARTLSPRAAPQQIISVLDIPAEIDARRQARDARLKGANPLVLTIEDVR